MLKKAVFTLYSMAMLATSLVPMDPSQADLSFMSTMSPSLQNILHIPMLAGFFLLLSSLRPRGAFVWPAVILALLSGAALELIQIPVPGRYASFADIVLNGMGVVLGMGCLAVIRRLWGESRG